MSQFIGQRSCVKCGRSHGMVVEDKESGECKAVDLCYDCMMIGTCDPIKEQIEIGSLSKYSPQMKRLFVDGESRSFTFPFPFPHEKVIVHLPAHVRIEDVPEDPKDLKKDMESVFDQVMKNLQY